MNGYPVGTKCVITFVPEIYTLARGWLGRVVTVLGPSMGSTPIYFAHLPRVSIDIPNSKGTTLWFAYPVDWMIPLDDGITEDDMDVVRQLSRPREMA